MDNNGEAYATVLILAVDAYNQTVSNINQTLRVGSDLDKMGMVLIIDGTRVNDVRVYEDGIVPTVISRYGTGGGNVPMVFPNEKVVAPTLSASNNPSRSPQSSEITAQVDAMVRETNTVRRLTPTECERLQGFPDGWTDGQADSNRYKQMGNAVAVPVVQWIVNAMVGE